MTLSPDERAAALALAREAAVDAGELLLSHLGRLDPAEIGAKSDARDLVTRADVESERLLVSRIREAFPDHAIEAEEEVRDARDDDRPRWFLDPLDGTVNFVHRLPCFAVSIGVWSGAVGEVAVVHAPRLGETFWASRGGGAHQTNPGEDGARGAGRPIAVSTATELSEAVLGTGFPYRRNELPDDNLANFGVLFPRVRGLRRMGSCAIDLAYTASGRLDAFWELHLSPHDLAGGALLVREAGGIVTDLDGGDDWLRAGHVVAGPEALHGALLPLVEHA